MIPIPISRCEPNGNVVRDAEAFANACTTLFEAKFGKNQMKSGAPICCVNLECDYWQLECNDLNVITREQCSELANQLCHINLKDYLG